MPPKPKKPIIPPAPKPMPHADSPSVLTDSDEFSWRCPHDGQLNSSERCTTCGTAK